MSTTTNCQDAGRNDTYRKIFRLRARCLAVALALALSLGAGLLASGPAHAQYPVIDVTNETNTSMTNASVIAGWAKEVAQWEQTLAHYMSMLTTLENLTTSFNLTSAPSLSRISDPSSYLSAACPNPQGVIGTVTNLLGLQDILSTNMSNLSPSQIQQVQTSICQNIVLRQIDQYNLIVQAMGSLGQFTGLMNTIDQKYNQLLSLANSLTGNAQGNVQGMIQQGQQAANKLNSQMQIYKQQIDADSTVIQTLKEQQAIVARIAMLGNNTPLGQVIQATAFATAFSN